MKFSSLTHQEWTIFFVSVALALLFFIPVYYFLGEKGLFQGGGDTSDYHALANSFLNHGVFARETAPPYTPSARAMPGYPFLLATSKYFFGNSIGIILLQILAFGGTVVLTFKITSMFFYNNRGAILSTSFFFIDFFALYTALTVLTDTLFTFFLTFSFFFFFRFLYQHDSIFFFFSCFFLGVASLFRPAGTGIFLIYALFYFFQVKKNFSIGSLKRHIFVFFAGGLFFFLLVVPWSIRNYMHFGTFRPAPNDAYTMYLLPAKRVQALADGVPFYVSLTKQRREFAEKLEQESGCTAFEAENTFKCVGWLQQQSFTIFKKHPFRLLQTIALGSWTYSTYAEWSNPWVRWKLLPSYPPPSSTPLREIMYHPSWPMIREQFLVRWQCGFSCMVAPALLLAGKFFWIFILLFAGFGVNLCWKNRELRVPLMCLIVFAAYFILLHGFLLSSIDIGERTRLPIFPLLFALAAGGVTYVVSWLCSWFGPCKKSDLSSYFFKFFCGNPRL